MKRRMVKGKWGREKEDGKSKMGKVVRLSGSQVFRCSGGQVVR